MVWTSVMGVAPLLVLLSATPLPGTGVVRPPSRWMKATDTQRAEAITAAQSLPLADRLVALSEGYLNTPYWDSPLGEGTGPDPDPLVRYDAVDCLTFVEQTVAMALSKNASEFLPMLNLLRYDGPVSYETRNHLMEAQWLPSNLRRGFLENVTREIAGTDVREAEKTLTSQSWKTPFARQMNLPPQRHLVGTFTLDVLPLGKVEQHMANIPSGTVMVIVRDDRANKPTRVTHVGFLVRQGEHVYLRHAARSVFQRVVDEDLRHFLRRNARYAHYPVTGVALYRVHDPGLFRF